MYAFGEILDIFDIPSLSNLKYGVFTDTSTENGTVITLPLAGWGRVTEPTESTSIEPVFLYKNNILSLTSLSQVRLKLTRLSS